MFIKFPADRHLVLLFMILLICSCRQQVEYEPGVEILPVTITIAEESVFRHNINTSGRLNPSAELKLSFKTGGIIDHISVREGQLVNAGDIMASLNLDEIRSRLRQSELMHEKALRDYERMENLYADTVVTLEQLQNAGTALELAESARSVARFNLDHSVITAPVDGHVMKILAEENEIISPGFPALLFAASWDQWLLTVAVTDRDFVHISEGDRALVRFDAYPEKVFDAVVADVPGMADPYTGAFGINIAISSPEKRLMAGFIGKATIITSRTGNYITVPPEAIVEANGREGSIYVYRSGKAYRAQVKIEEITDTGLLVTGNIKAGDSIITDGARFAGQGQQVRIYEPR
jgi:membrane fusion protein, multidrug efflux system